MAAIHIPPGWRIPESRATSESAYQNRRAFLKKMGLGTIAVASAAHFPGCGPKAAHTTPTLLPDGPLDTIPKLAPREGYPAMRSRSFDVPERPITTYVAAASYNNFYEFIFDGDLKNVWPLTGAYEPFPMTIAVKGLVEKPFTLDVADLIREMDLEERLYRFRCVEAWSMTIPWTGFPLRRLIERCKPLLSATHVRFVSVNRPKQMPGITKGHWYPWPYYEGLRMAEATNNLAFVATGMYGNPLPKQNGSPLRLVLPWKYGYKGPKAVVEIEFVDRQPPTFWNDLQVKEYGFLSNVNPNIPHVRWTQAKERFISDVDTIEERPTALFNGYSTWVGSLYPDEPTEFTRMVR